MKKLILPLAILVMALLLGAAVVVDCVRLASDARHRVQLADAEMMTHEKRLVKLLSGYSNIPPMVRSDLDTYQTVDNPRDRHNTFYSLVVSFHKTMSGKIDPTNPLDRKFMDDIAGAINRREIAEKQYDEESAACQEYLNSWRGRLARTFSSQAQVDWNMTANPLPTIRDVERNAP